MTPRPPAGTPASPVAGVSDLRHAIDFAEKVALRTREVRS